MKSIACLLTTLLLGGCARHTSVTAPAPPAIQDSIEWVSAAAIPNRGSLTELERGKPQRFDVTLRYTLATRASAKLSLSLTQVQNPDSCIVSPAEYVEADEIDIHRGTNVVTLPITWPGDTGLRTKGRVYGYGSVSFAAAMWRAHLQDPFYSTKFGQNFCLRFGMPAESSPSGGH